MSSTNRWLDTFHSQARAGNLPAPANASWIVTRACNLSCEYCFANAGKKDPDELSTSEAKAIIDDFATSGVASITFLGGEPLSRSDIFQLIDYATDRGIYTGVLSNGFLTTSEIVFRLSSVGCEILGVSLDSNDPCIHDAIRGKVGSLAGALRTIRAAISLKMRSSLRIVVTEKSYPAIPALFQWALDEGVEELIVIPLFLVGRAKTATAASDRDLNAKALFLHTLDTLRSLAAPKGIQVPPDPIGCPQGIELNSPKASCYHLGHAVGFNRSAGCKVGRYTVSVQPNGDVYPCSFVPIRIGNLRTQSIRQIWQAPLLHHERKERLGCLARSLIHTGSAWRRDPTYAEGTSISE